MSNTGGHQEILTWEKNLVYIRLNKLSGSIPELLQWIKQIFLKLHFFPWKSRDWSFTIPNSLAGAHETIRTERELSLLFGLCECRCECLQDMWIYFNPLEIILFKEGIYIKNFCMISCLLHAQFDWIHWYIPPYVHMLKPGQLDLITNCLILNHVRMVSYAWKTWYTHLLFLQCSCCSMENYYLFYFCPFPLFSMCLVSVTATSKYGNSSDCVGCYCTSSADWRVTLGTRGHQTTWASTTEGWFNWI